MTAFAAGFPRFSEADWRAIAGPLKANGDSRIKPIQAVADGPPIIGREPGVPWSVVARIAAGADSAAINARIRDELDGGANAIELVFGTSPSAWGQGLDARAVDWAAVFAGVRLSETRIRLDAGEATPTLADGLLNLAEAEGGAIDLTVAFDPIATMAATGRLSRPIDVLFASLAAIADGKGFHPVIADGAIWHNAGASEAQELAAVIAGVAEYLRLFDDRAVPLAQSVGRIGVTLAAEADQLTTIAKIRAMRLLHARLLEAVGAPASRLQLHAATSWRMLSRLDPHTNILRTTSAVFAAGVGGADSVTALPFDAVSGGDDHFARRIARNSQTILIDESELAVVADPGAGSGAVEALTGGLAEGAWERFRDIERQGGLLASVRSGAMQRMIAETRERRVEDVRRGRIEIVGTNAYPDLADHDLTAMTNPVVDRPVISARDTADALRFIRPAEAFEALRDKARARTPKPRVALATMGKNTATTAAYAAGVFALAGILPDATGDGGEAALACICVGGEVGTAEIAKETARLRSQGAARVYLAGTTEVVAGVDAVIVDGIDLVDLLEDALRAPEGRRK